jgi:predicted metal-binding protein
MNIEVLRHKDDVGNEIWYERYEQDLHISEFDHSPKYKAACGECPRRGRNLACPPFSPIFADYIDDAQSATIICIRLPMEYYTNVPLENRYRSCFRKAASILVDALLSHRKKGRLVLGSGACLTCEQCAAEVGVERCKKPEKQVYSLESVGVNVIGLVNTCFDIDLEWSADEHTAQFVCAVGAVFFQEEEPFTGA